MTMPAIGSVYTMSSCALRRAVARSRRSKNTPDATPHAAPTAPPRTSHWTSTVSRARRVIGASVARAADASRHRGRAPDSTTSPWLLFFRLRVEEDRSSLLRLAHSAARRSHWQPVAAVLGGLHRHRSGPYRGAPARRSAFSRVSPRPLVLAVLAC